MEGNKVYPEQNMSTDKLLDESKDDSNKQNDIDENRKTFQNSFNNSSSKHSDGLESNSDEEEKKQNSSDFRSQNVNNIEARASISDNPSQDDGSNDSTQEITDEDLNQDLSETPNYYAPVIEEEAIREELKAKLEYERNMEDHREIGEKMEEEELKLLQQNYLNYYDQISITLTCYGDQTNQKQQQYYLYESPGNLYSWHTTYSKQNPVLHNFEIRPSGDSQSTEDLSDNILYFSNNEYYKEFKKEKYCEMVSEQQDKYSFGRHSLTHNFKPNLPFILYWTSESRALRYINICEIDSVGRDDFFKSEMSEGKRYNEPVVMYFGEQAEVNVSKPVDTNTEYTLFTYLNNTRYYLTRGYRYNTDDSEQYMLILTSVKNRDTIKGNRQYRLLLTYDLLF